MRVSFQQYLEKVSSNSPVEVADMQPWIGSRRVTSFLISRATLKVTMRVFYTRD